MIDQYVWRGGKELMLRFGPADGPLVIVTLPLFEEANRLRAFAVTLCRALVDERRTMVFFESPHRIGDSLADLVEAMGPERRVVVCRELTKMFEEVRRGTLAELVAWAEGGVKGEITIVVAGAERVVHHTARITANRPPVVASAAGSRQPSGPSPSSAMPSAISSLPSNGCSVLSGCDSASIARAAGR